MEYSPDDCAVGFSFLRLFFQLLSPNYAPSCFLFFGGSYVRIGP